jgi:hypothetical protein
MQHPVQVYRFLFPVCAIQHGILSTGGKVWPKRIEWQFEKQGTIQIKLRSCRLVIPSEHLLSACWLTAVDHRLQSPWTGKKVILDLWSYMTFLPV